MYQHHHMGAGGGQGPAQPGAVKRHTLLRGAQLHGDGQRIVAGLQVVAAHAVQGRHGPQLRAGMSPRPQGVRHLLE